MESLVTVCSLNPEGPKTGALGLSLDSIPTHSMAQGQGHCLDPSAHLLKMGAQPQLSHCRGQQEQNQKVDWNILTCYKNKVFFVFRIIHDHATALPRATFEKRSWVGRTRTTAKTHTQSPTCFHGRMKSRHQKDRASHAYVTTICLISTLYHEDRTLPCQHKAKGH